MKTSEFPEVEAVFGNLSKPPTADNCSVAKKQTDSIACKWQTIAGLRFCDVHKGIQLTANK